MAVAAGTFGFALLSALVPVLNVEAYLLAAAVTSDAPAALLAAVAAAGQMGGKMLYYLMGRGVIDVARLRRRSTAKGRWAQRMDAVRAWCERHTWGSVGLTLVSAFVGLPPFAVVSVLAGSLRMPWVLFLVAGLVGRYGRFLAILLAPGLLPGGLH
jgi:membrane protein YqaA with SNARE-associated domain